MTWCNKCGNHYLFNDVRVSLLSILIPCIILYEHYCLHLLHCTWLGFIRTCTKQLIHGILTNRWLVHNWVMGLGNLLEVVVVSLLDLNNESNTNFFLYWLFRVKVLTFRFGCSQTLNSNYWRWNWSCLTFYIMSFF